MTTEQIARVCHEVNRALCEAFGDNTQPSWDNAPDWQRASALNGVRLHLDNRNAGPRDSHDSWAAEKVATGWVYGEVKDAEKKTHPCLVPYDELPPEQKAKDFVFWAIVNCLRS